MSKLPLYAKPTAEIDVNIGNEFKNYLENVRKNDLAVVHRTKKLCVPFITGKSVSVEEERQPRRQYYKNRTQMEVRKNSHRVLRGQARTRGGRAKSDTIRTLKPDVPTRRTEN